VKYISLDRPLTPSLSNAAPAVNAFAAWQSGYTGAGVGVALIDSGVAEPSGFARRFLEFSRVVYNQSFVSGTNSTRSVWSRHSHRRPDRG